MPGESHQVPILSCDPAEQLAALWGALAPERWPLPVALLPGDALLVGGAVRDALLGRLRPHPDLDLVVEDDAIALARSLARRCGGTCVVLDAERSIARLVINGWSFDLARRMGASLSEDLARRDYSVNAIALPLAGWPGAAGSEAEAGGPVDPGGGLEDLRARRMRALGEANLLEDPLRLLRGVRLACELGFSIEPQTLAWIHAHHRRLGEVAGERVLAELERLACAPAGAAGLGQALELGLLSGWQPPAQASGPPGGLSTRPADSEPDRGLPATPAPELERLTLEQAHRCGLDPAETERALPLARLAAVLPQAALARLHASRRLQQRCGRQRQWLQRLTGSCMPGTGAEPLAGAPGPLTLAVLPEAERLALQQELEEDLPALLLHLEPSEAQQALQRWRDGEDPLFHPRPPLDGRRLQQALGLPPGRTLGLLLAHLTRERAFGRLARSGMPETALQAARDWLEHRGDATGENGGGGRRD